MNQETAVRGRGRYAPPLPPIDELIPFAQVADRLGVCQETVRRWTRQKENRLACWSVGRARFTSQRALTEFVKANQSKATARA